MAAALVIVDVQIDLTPGGALAAPHGDEARAPGGEVR
jgi:nicotinamidase-related amidase